MANLLQAVAAALLLGGTAQAATFSHRVHLNLKIECVACHASVPRSARASDNNLPQRAVCLGCHADTADLPAIKQATLTALAHFSHQVHMRFRTCLSCHAGIDTSERTSKANLPPMSTCVTCHVQNDIPNGCWKCHDRAMKLEPESHVRGFGDSHSRGKMSVEVKQACAVCHAPGFRCAGCH